jgi:uncharacterized membrane protein
MHIDSFFGVPAHPLFVHLPVVLTPLALVTAILAIRKSTRPTFLWITAALAGMAFAGAQFAVDSGEALEERVRESAGLELHANLGEATRTLIAVFFVVALLMAAYELYMSRRGGGSSVNTSIVRVLTVTMLLTGALATTWVARTGHQGAKITWEDVGTRE